MKGNSVGLYQLFRSSLIVILVDLNLQLFGGGENANHSVVKAKGLPYTILGTIINTFTMLHLHLDI